MATTEEFEAAGLYDGKTDASTGRLELLQWLDDNDFSIVEMVEAHATIGLGALAGDKKMLPGDRLDHATAVALSGLTSEEFDAMATAFGFTAPDSSRPDDLQLTEAEVRCISGLGVLAQMFSDEEALGFIRVIGSAMARIGEAGMAMFLTDIESHHLAQAGDELELAKKVLAATALLDDFLPMLDPVLRRHMYQSVERNRLATIDAVERLRYRYAVGFVDLVGFTPISHGMDARQLGQFIREFEERAHTAATGAGARVVKLIGDEVMFVAPDANAACDIAQTLMSSFRTETGRDVLPRGGLAYGDVLIRGGDYYGEIVNLASRLVDDASPCELLVSDVFAKAADKHDFAAAADRILKGFSDPVAVRSMQC